MIEEANKDRKHSQYWVYHDALGSEVGAAVRYVDEDGSKRVLPMSVNAKGRWVKKAMAEPRPLYDLHQLAKLPANSLVFVVEGEKSAEASKTLGLVATTSSQGSKAAKKTDWSPLAGHDVVILPDNDEPGITYQQEVVELIHGLDPRPKIRIVNLPGLPEKGDIVDWIQQGGEKQKLLKLLEATTPWEPAPEPWPDLQRYEEVDVPEFPTHALPSPVREWVEAESVATQTPPDLAALLALAFCAATIARRLTVQPRSSWTEPTNVYVAVVLDPAIRKSAVFADATKPLCDLEQEEVDAARERVAVEQSQKRRAQKQLEKLDREIAKNPTADKIAQADDLARELSNGPEPVLPRRIVDDATQEKLGMMLAEQGGRMGSMSPEGGVFDHMAGQYSKSGIASFDTYLKAHSGDSLRTERVTRQPVYVERPALTIAYAIQWAVLQGLNQKQTFRGRGLLGRFLYAAPKSWIGERLIAPPSVPEEVVQGYHQLVRKLGVCELEGCLRLETKAVELLADWEQHVEHMLGDGGELSAIRDWGGKLVGQTVRLAGILHCIKHAGDNSLLAAIDSETIHSAITIAKYLIPHAEYVLSEMAKDSDDESGCTPVAARTLLGWIKRKKKEHFTKRVAHQGISLFKRQNTDVLDAILRELCERGYLREIPATPKSGPGRPASPVFEVNPAFLEPEVASQSGVQQNGDSHQPLDPESRARFEL